MRVTLLGQELSDDDHSVGCFMVHMTSLCTMHKE